MKTKILFISCLTFFLILTSFIIFKNKKNQNNDSHTGIDFGKFEINNIRSWFHNNGIVNLDSTRINSGFEWPKDSMKNAKYVSGIWLGAKVGNDTLITHAWYGSQYLPGFIDDNGNLVKAIDKDVLMQEIASEIVEGGQERYQFTWPDKRNAIVTANAPISKTVRPCREEGVNFDENNTLYIEGDN